MTTEYTNNFRLAKPDFRSGPWASSVNQNFDTIYSVIVNTMITAGIEAWENDTAYTVGKLRMDLDASPPSFWVCILNHTSPSTPTTFAEDRVSHTDRWSALTFAVNPRGPWANDTAYGYYDIAYDSTLGITGICIIPHTSNSSGTIQDDSSKWAFIVDLPSQGTVAASSVSYDHTTSGLTATDAQAAIDELDGRIDSAATVVSGVIDDVDTLTTDLDNLTTTVSGNSGDISTLQSDVDAIEVLNAAQTARLDALDAEVAAIDSSSFDTGTKMLFYQASAPTGWTKQTADNDKAIRVVSGTGGTSAGSNNFSTVMAQTTVGATTISTSTMPSHSHTYPADTSTGGIGTNSAGRIDSNNSVSANPSTSSVGGGGSHTHSITMDIKYIDVIVCAKD
jgi:hypothetical protein